MKDNFSEIAVEYSKFRPHYPDAMIEFIVSFAKEKNTALDLATGNGQVAKKLSKYFKTVYATDISASQIANSEESANIIYKVEPAEKTTFEDHFFDLVTVAQSIHWFDFETFYPELFRILKPDGIFAVLGYGLFSTNPESDKILHEFYYNIVGPYWDLERKYLDEMYTTIPFPLDEIQTESFENRFSWTFNQLTGYIETWSATQHYKNATGENPVDQIREQLRESWEISNKEVVFPLILRIGKLKTNNPS
ncbi:MAG: class I SAM-dependent methyltransferase [Flavobacterium sp.]|nr:MAG: class I SAM-dependent methyltransferase [Flavobacterium sp.]